MKACPDPCATDFLHFLKCLQNRLSLHPLSLHCKSPSFLHCLQNRQTEKLRLYRMQLRFVFSRCRIRLRCYKERICMSPVILPDCLMAHCDLGTQYQTRSKISIARYRVYDGCDVPYQCPSISLLFSIRNISEPQSTTTRRHQRSCGKKSLNNMPFL
jgi:hypothetical protein